LGHSEKDKFDGAVRSRSLGRCARTKTGELNLMEKKLNKRNVMGTAE
jgi:hypothetical protein